MGARKRNVKPAQARKSEQNEQTADAPESRSSKRIIFLIGVILCCVILFYVQLDIVGKSSQVATGRYIPGPAIVTTWKGI